LCHRKRLYKPRPISQPHLSSVDAVTEGRYNVFAMKIYLDNCSLQRPLDSRTSTRVILEAEAILSVLTLLESGRIELISSEVLLFEIKKDPSSTRREYALEVLSRASTFVQLRERAEKRAARFVALGIKPLDALHLASAEDAKADCFCTCDDRFLQKAKAIADLTTRPVSPIELIQELEP
jgi:predicted nucleic acid-binding protein